MSHISSGIFGALAISATFGAVQFASGHDLIGRLPSASTAAESGVNRAAKTDRIKTDRIEADRAAVRAAPAQTRTISLRLDGLADTSVVVRFPDIKEESHNRAMLPTKPGVLKTTVACEPPVSVLAEVAKWLQPGRCVT